MAKPTTLAFTAVGVVAGIVTILSFLNQPKAELEVVGAPQWYYLTMTPEIGGVSYEPFVGAPVMAVAIENRGDRPGTIGSVVQEIEGVLYPVPHLLTGQAGGGTLTRGAIFTIEPGHVALVAVPLASDNVFGGPDAVVRFVPTDGGVEPIRIDVGPDSDPDTVTAVRCSEFPVEVVAVCTTLNEAMNWQDTGGETMAYLWCGGILSGFSKDAAVERDLCENYEATADESSHPGSADVAADDRTWTWSILDRSGTTAEREAERAAVDREETRTPPDLAS